MKSQFTMRKKREDGMKRDENEKYGCNNGKSAFVRCVKYFS